MLPNVVGMVFMGIMAVLVAVIYFLYGRHVLLESAVEDSQPQKQDMRQYFMNYGESDFEDNNLDRTVIRGLEETVLFQPQEQEEAMEREAMQNTMVLPRPEKDGTMGNDLEEDMLLSVRDIAAAAIAGDDAEPIAMPKEDAESTIMAAPVLQPLEKNDKVLGKNDPQPFGSQTCWLAIHAKSMKEVAEVLEVEKAHSCDWQAGLAASQQNDGSVFVTPAIGDWVLVIGRSILKKIGLDYPIDNFKWMKEVSEQFGLVYYFCTHEKAQYQAWIKADKGEVERAYAYSGKDNDVFWEWGEITDTESALLRSLEAFYGNQTIDEAVVLALAAKWTVDTSFRNVKNVKGPGLLGTLK